MLTKIRPAALVAAFLFLSLYPIASNAGTPEPDNAFDWLKIVFNHTDPGNMDPGAITVLYDQADTLTAARPTFFDELKKIPKDDTNPDGPETIAMIKEGIERRLKEADFPQARKTHLTEVKGDWKKITLQDVFDALKAEKKKDDGEKEEDSPWTKWATAKNAPHAKNIQKALQELGKPAKSGDDTTPDGSGDPSQHGAAQGNINAQNYANSLWDRIQANDEWKKLLGTTSEDEFKKLAQNLFKEKLDGPEGRIEAAKQLAEKHPGLLERWQALGDDEFKTALGFPRGDDRALALFGKKDDPGSYGLLGAREQTDEKLYSDIFDQSKTNLQRRIAKEEFDRRKTSEAGKKKLEDFKNMRADLIQYYGGGTDALNDPKWKDWNPERKIAEMKKAATSFATLIGTVPDLKEFKERKGKEGASLYDRQLGEAADLAEQIRTNKIKLIDPKKPITWDNIEGFTELKDNSPGSAFKNQFVKDYLQVHNDNLKFEHCVDAVNAGPSHADFAWCKPWLNDNYSGANLQDYVNTKLASEKADDKVRAARTVIATGLKKDGENYVMDFNIHDTDAVKTTYQGYVRPSGQEKEPATGLRVVVGKSGDTNEEVVQQVLATLDRFKQQGTLPEDNTVTEAFEGLSTDPKYGRLRNVGLLAANSQDVPTKLFYATADGAKLDVATPGPGGFTLPAGKTLARKEAVKLPEKYKTQDTWLPGAKAPAVAEKPTEPVKKDGPTGTQPPVPTSATVFGAGTRLTGFDKLNEAKRTEFVSTVGATGACISCHKTDGGPDDAAKLMTKLKEKDNAAMVKTLTRMAGYAEDNQNTPLKQQIESYLAAFR